MEGGERLRLAAMIPGATALAVWRWPVGLVALAGYSLLAVVLTWPLAGHLGDRFPGQRPDDAYGHYWNLWWFKQAISTGLNPYHTPLWYPPEGVDLYVGTLAPINGLLGLLPQLLAGPLVAYNLLVLLNIALAGHMTFLLARQVTGHLGGAAVGGLVVAASPHLIGQINVGHLNVATIYGVPWLAYALLRVAGGQWRHGPLAALALLAAALADWQTAVSGLVIAGVLLVAETVRAVARRSFGPPLRMVVAGALGGLLLLPLVVVTAQAVNAAGSTALLGERINRAANLLAFWLPQELHPLWGDAIHQWRRANLWEPLPAGRMALGLTVLALAALGIARAGRAMLPWLVLLLLGIGLTLGPDVHIGLHAYPVPTPFTVLNLLPYIDVSRNPGYYVLIANIGVAVLAAFGVRWLATRPGLRRRANLLVSLVFLLVLAELWPAPFTLTRPPDTAVAEQIGREIAAADPAGTVLTLPYKGDEQYILFHQVHHQRPIHSTAGALSRLPEPPLRSTTPGFTHLARDRPEPDLLQPPVEPLVALNAFRVRFVLYYPLEVPERERAGYRRRLREVLQQAEPAYRAADGALEAWRVPVVAVEQPFLRVGTGWQRAETWTGIGTGRWLRGAGTLVLERPTSTATTLRFTAVSFARPRTLEVRLDDTLLVVVPVTTSATPVTVEVPAGHGRATLRFEAREGVNPRDQELFQDRRPLTIGLAEVSVTAAAAAAGGR